MTATSGPLRALRAALLGSVCLTISLAGHVLAGGRTPGLVAVLLLSVPVGCLSLLLTARRLSRASLFAVLAAGQLALHEGLMGLTAAPGCRPGAGHEHLTAAGSMATAPATSIARGCLSAPAMVMAPGSGRSLSGVGMLLAHVLAALACALVLAYGERLAFAALGWVSGRRSGLVRPVSGPVLRGTRSVVGPLSVGWSVSAGSALGGSGRRGPPRTVST